MVDVSVVIPCIHEFPQLYQTVFSIQNEFVDENYTYEIIIAENGEEDPHTPKFLHVFRDIRPAKIRHIFEPRQCGPIARNTGARIAEGKYLVFTDGHVCWGKNTFPILVETMEAKDAGIVHGSTVWSHYNEHHAGCHYSLAGNLDRPQLLTHGHGFYQRCRGKTEPYLIAGGTGAYILFRREEFLKLRGYHKACRYYPHPEGYIDLKYWMFNHPVYVAPKAFHYHSLYPRNYGKGPQDYCNQDHHIENVMICMYTLGGEPWLRKVVEARKMRGGKVGVLEMLAENARTKAKEEHEWILDNASRTLDETLQELYDNRVAGMENGEQMGLKPRPNKPTVNRDGLNVLVLVDSPTWAGATVMQGVARHSRHNLTLGYMTSRDKSWMDRPFNYDVCYIHVGGIYYRQIRSYFESHQDAPWILGIRGYSGWSRDHKIIDKFAAVSTGNHTLKQTIEKKGAKTFVCHAGLDTKLFKPAFNHVNPFTIGWAGHARLSVKQFREFEKLPYKQMVATPDKIEHPNSRSYPHNRMPIFYNSINIFVSTSVKEGFNLPPLEAAACGKPVVALRSGALDEWMPQEYLVDNPDELKDKIELFRTDLERYEMECLRFRALSLPWDFKFVAQEYDYMFEQVKKDA